MMHLAIALGVGVTKQRRRVLITRAADLIGKSSKRDPRALTRLQQRRRVRGLIVAELGFLPLIVSGRTALPF